MKRLRGIARRLLPKPIKRGFRRIVTTCELSYLRRRLKSVQPRSVIRWRGYRLQITDAPNFYIQCKDEFFHQIYRCHTSRPDPFIIDGGSNIGMSILAFKDVHPEAEIIAFEPDHEIAQILRENLRTNSISGVTVVEAGLSGVDGTARFRPDNSAGGQIVESSEGECVPTERLSKFLDRHVDFVKLNIEGQELPVLEELEATGKLSNVQEIVLEYHGWPNSQQHLGDILNLLARNRFRYLVHDFDNETCPQTKPPFRMRDDIPWFCLVYACRQNG